MQLLCRYGVVMNVFGKDVMNDPEPMGLKRMTKEEWPDQWWGRFISCPLLAPRQNKHTLRRYVLLLFNPSALACPASVSIPTAHCSEPQTCNAYPPPPT
jgi:hypothetical protein